MLYFNIGVCNPARVGFLFAWDPREGSAHPGVSGVETLPGSSQWVMRVIFLRGLVAGGDDHEEDCGNGEGDAEDDVEGQGLAKDCYANDDGCDGLEDAKD